jgi:hypothetical protein
LAHERSLGLSGKGINFGGNDNEDKALQSKTAALQTEVQNADAYYNDVYGSIQFDQYLSNYYVKSTASQYASGGGGGGAGGGDQTKFDDNMSQPSGIQHDQGLSQLSKLLASLPCPKILCSNSPQKQYIDPFLTEMNMMNIGWSDIVTPSTFLHPKKNTLFCKKGEAKENAFDENSELITKSNPKFYENILKRFPLTHYQVILFDDSLLNLKVAEACGIISYLVKPQPLPNNNFVKRTLYDAILESLHSLTPSLPHGPMGGSNLSDSQTLPVGGDLYLAAKQVADDQSLNKEVQGQLISLLKSLAGDRSKSPNQLGALRVLDTGAGTLTMLPRVVEMAAAAGFNKVDAHIYIFIPYRLEIFKKKLINYNVNNICSLATHNILLGRVLCGGNAIHIAFSCSIAPRLLRSVPAIHQQQLSLEQFNRKSWLI